MTIRLIAIVGGFLIYAATGAVAVADESTTTKSIRNCGHRLAEVAECAALADRVREAKAKASARALNESSVARDAQADRARAGKKMDATRREAMLEEIETHRREAVDAARRDGR